jgi:hypothetical protein
VQALSQFVIPDTTVLGGSPESLGTETERAGEVLDARFAVSRMTVFYRRAEATLGKNGRSSAAESKLTKK